MRGVTTGSASGIPQVTSLRPIAVAAYGPTILSSVGTGAVLPVLALTARDLGASVGTAAVVVALLGVGMLAGDLPAGALAARIGERRALLAASLAEAVAMAAAGLAPSVLTLGAAVLALGLAGSVFGLARHAYLAEAVAPTLRARALSTLGECIGWAFSSGRSSVHSPWDGGAASARMPSASSPRSPRPCWWR